MLSGILSDSERKQSRRNKPRGSIAFNLDNVDGKSDNQGNLGGQSDVRSGLDDVTSPAGSCLDYTNLSAVH